MKTITTFNELVENIKLDKITMLDNNRYFDMILENYDTLSNLEGDIVECGVWRGGMSIFLSHLFSDKNIWVCDSFQGFQPLQNAKHSYSKERHTPNYTHGATGPLAISLEEVQDHFKNYGLGDERRIKFLKGFVKDTLPNSGIEKISLLRVDVDAYSATLETLEELYPKVVKGGMVIFDDSCLYETKDAIINYFSHNNIPLQAYHPITSELLDLTKSYTNDDSGLPGNCYIFKA
jgi:hypothetical protein